MKLRYIVPACLALASVAVADSQDGVSVAFVPTSLNAPFLEQFASGWERRWTPSETKKSVDGVEDEELLRYRGQWGVEEPQNSVISGDEGLVVKTAAAHHAIAAKFDKPVDPTGKSLVVQYEVKLQNGLECGGAYMKLLSQDNSFDPKKFDDKTPYTIMFGPDKCGLTNKVHFIFRHKNPKTGEFEEKHVNAPPAAKADKNTHLYTLIVNPDQSFKILIDNEEVKKGSLLEDFTPSVNPPKEIDDPNDKKPSDWVEEAQIPDPKATKPDDWDEEAPLEIVDEDAKKPSDWLDDEPLTIPDPEAQKPEDWDDEEDGDWVAPTIPNPKCEKASGCGEWKKPTKRNPNYKGKWKAPLIDNPKYKGPWAPRKIPNPNYFEDKTPSNFNKIGAIGFELWTMQDKILFDNIYVGHSAEDAKKLAEESFAIKAKLEKKDEPKPEKEKGETKDLPLLERVNVIKDQVLDFVQRVQKDPVEAIQELPQIAAGVIGTAIVVPMLLVGAIISMGSKKPAAKKVKKVDVAAKKKDAQPDEDEEEEEEEVVVVKKKDEKKDGAQKRKTAGKKDKDEEDEEDE
ncbi:uncharacterized protein SPPG_05332 [Spizellomyces punctatus DAOM BR117]|uniref:Calnexin n=1 Tax=Spizellomyces punctatus (strain DAOM BR117) TaxID=645134 RepID=A0A0L0HER8_SPIPD|nr:uncharacterized protein SPPG_05332 [Spizellomyces punctatus DAOM BR117]KNC99960.1 hypothetical protein SPPG_05332 [Spizellomyces punctatus DAOM BR117]|eukprot:XP_016608000.1 hypothetical protein SPPG_05332 [Spizellomyces punctatus DAOM BR117]